MDDQSIASEINGKFCRFQEILRFLQSILILNAGICTGEPTSKHLQLNNGLWLGTT